jgi:hypothetical protein
MFEGVSGCKNRPIAITGGAPCSFFRGNIQKNYRVPLQEVTSGLREHCPAAETYDPIGTQRGRNVLRFKRTEVLLTELAKDFPARLCLCLFNKVVRVSKFTAQGMG